MQDNSATPFWYILAVYVTVLYYYETMLPRTNRVFVRVNKNVPGSIWRGKSNLPVLGATAGMEIMLIDVLLQK